ncbi:hypothetical protein [Cryobacterium sp. TMT4-10]|uniref:hypothetical protein n=1 Tax=Cryobacterium sp. TMT4-10 TaxID=1259256 RepID=UPI00106BB1E0|nr:hypothetical protein [Cryobacterium sp. TMT4-10]TFD13138.1 hypothetical protein E3T42_14300 [Cryobacterium sp. TMT4-10]
MTGLHGLPGTRSSKHRYIAAAITVTAALLLTGCTSTPTITGMWTASDGSATKIVNDDGSCSGMYYNGTTPLDIGGGMTCTLSDTKSNGFYTLVVSQPPNQASYQVRFDGDDMVMSSGGVDIVTLTKQ